MRLRSYLLWIGLVLVLSSCHSAQAGPESARPELTNQQKASPVVMQPPPGSIDLDTPTSMAAERTAEPTASPSVSPGTSAIPTVTAPATATIIPTSDPAEWQNLPVIPEVGEAARAIYRARPRIGQQSAGFLQNRRLRQHTRLVFRRFRSRSAVLPTWRISVPGTGHCSFSRLVRPDKPGSQVGI